MIMKKEKHYVPACSIGVSCTAGTGTIHIFFGKVAEMQEQKVHCRQKLQAVYGMKLQEEQIGHAVDVLEVTVTLHPKTEAGIRLRLKVLDWQAGRMTDVRRWPDAIPSNVQDILPSLSMEAA